MNQKNRKGKACLAPSLIDLLKSAGFQTLEKQTDRILYASGAKDFSAAHAKAMKPLCKHPDFVGASPFGTGANRVLIVYRIENPKSEIENAS